MSEPIRTCVGCRSREPKSALIRLVARGEAGPAGATVVLDPRRRLPGRGAYVHRREACLGRALKRGQLARALRVDLAPARAASLRMAFAAQSRAGEDTARSALTGRQERTEYEQQTATVASRTMSKPEDGRSEIPGEE